MTPQTVLYHHGGSGSFIAGVINCLLTGQDILVISNGHAHYTSRTGPVYAINNPTLISNLDKVLYIRPYFHYEEIIMKIQGLIKYNIPLYIRHKSGYPPIWWEEDDVITQAGMNFAKKYPTIPFTQIISNQHYNKLMVWECCQQLHLPTSVDTSEPAHVNFAAVATNRVDLSFSCITNNDPMSFCSTVESWLDMTLSSEQINFAKSKFNQYIDMQDKLLLSDVNKYLLQLQELVHA